MSLPVETTAAVVRVTMSPDASFNLGGRVILRCRYTGVTRVPLLEVNWEHRPSGQQRSYSIWTYDGGRKTDTWHTNPGQHKFERHKSDISKEHAIRKSAAEVADDGTYICTVKYNVIGDFSENYATMQLIVLGMYMKVTI